MPNFRKKPVIIDATRVWDVMTVQTLEGAMTCKPGDWLITGVRGEKYFCDHEIFLQTYEPMDAEGQRLMFQDAGYSIAERDYRPPEAPQT